MYYVRLWKLSLLIYWTNFQFHRHVFLCFFLARCLPTDILRSSYNFTRSSSGYQKHFGYNVWRSELIREFSTGTFDKCRRLSPIATKYIRRPCSLFTIRHHYATVASKEQKSKKMLLYLTALVFVMVGSSYAAVPLYRRFCQATGYGGTVQRREVWFKLFWAVFIFLIKQELYVERHTFT